MTAPDRIWIAPTHRSNGVDDFYLLDPKYRDGRGTGYVRADIVVELADVLDRACSQLGATVDMAVDRGGEDIYKDTFAAARAAIARVKGE